VSDHDNNNDIAAPPISLAPLSLSLDSFFNFLSNDSSFLPFRRREPTPTMDVDLDRPLGEDEHMEYDDLPSASQPVGGEDHVADHDGDALMDDGEVAAGEEEMEAEPTPPLGDTLGDTVPGPGLSFPDSGSSSGAGVGFVAAEQAGLTAAPSGPHPEDTGVGGRKDGETREEDMTPAEDREGGGEAGAVKLPLTDLSQENVQTVAEHVGEDQHGPEGSGERVPGVDHRLTDSGDMAATAQATYSADQPGEASQNVTSGVANASVLPHTNGHTQPAAGNGPDHHAEDEVEGEDEEYYEEELEERDGAHGGHEHADGNGGGEEHIGEEEDEGAEGGDDAGDYSALSELALDVHSLPPIIIHLPDLGARALFAPLPPNEVDAGGKALSLPVWLEGRQEELGEASLTDVLAAIHAAVIREGLNQSGEMVIAEHSMDLKMGEVSGLQRDFPSPWPRRVREWRTSCDAVVFHSGSHLTWNSGRRQLAKHHFPRVHLGIP
jgi:hypothetical protein